MNIAATRIADAQLEAAALLRDRADALSFSSPVAAVYDPLSYAWGAFEEYVIRYGNAPKRVLFLGMNPGPWGMAQTGVPFGEVSIVKDWLQISAPVVRPSREHPKYPVDGYGCRRSEVSGKRLWGLFRERFGTSDAFFEEHFVANYCPLLFIAASVLKDGGEGARNLTPDKLSPDERAALYAVCGAHLRTIVEVLEPPHVIGIGNFAAARAEEALSGLNVRIGKILHPSPASPKSNSDWAGEAARQLEEQEIWK